MKKVISFVLSFFMIFLNVNVSKALGDPLDDNPSWYEKLREEFRWIEYQKGSQSPAVFTIKNEFDFVSHDYRTCRVYNFPKLFGNNDSDSYSEEEDGFLPCLTRMYTKAKEVFLANEKFGKYLGEAAIEVFRKDFIQEIKYTKEAKYLKEFIGADDGDKGDKTVADALLCSLGLEMCAMLARGAVIVGVLYGMSKLFIGLCAVSSIFLQKATFADQRAKNAALLIRGVYRILKNNPDGLGNVNVLITAIDERDFNSILPWNAFRRDDGIWYGLRHINNLSCAPMGKLYADRLKKYLQDYNNLFNGNNLAPEKMIEMGKKYSQKHRNGIFPECSIQ